MRQARWAVSLGLVLGLVLAAGPMAAYGATETAKATAIDKALAWLAGQQQGDGRWNIGDDNEDAGGTGAALLAFIDEGYSAGSPVIIDTGGGPVNYGDVVGKGLTYVFSRATTYPISNQPAGNPDSDGNGVGVKFVPGGNHNRDTYVTGIVASAVAATGTPGAVVANGPLTGWTYQQVVRNVVDYSAFGQVDSGNARGGWRYYANYDADNSTSQWPVIASLFATGMGVSAPAFMQSELKHWINYIQHYPTGDGGSDYDTGHGWGSNMSRTGALLIEMGFAGYPTGSAAEQARYLAALGYINSQWATYNNSTLERQLRAPVRHVVRVQGPGDDHRPDGHGRHAPPPGRRRH